MRAGIAQTTRSNAAGPRNAQAGYDGGNACPVRAGARRHV